MKKLILVFILSLLPSLAIAQTNSRNPCYTTNGTNCIGVGTSTPLPVTATVNASVGGFHQESVLTPFTATTSGVASSSFTAGKTVVVTNIGTTNNAYCQLGTSATTSSQPVAPNGGWFAFTSTSETQVTCATASSTTTINVSVGTGLPTGTGGGGSGGGGGGSNASVSSTGAAVPGSATYVGVNSGGNLTGWDGAVAQAGAWNVTANAGTDLNTSALALESGGNLAAIFGGVGASTDSASSAGGTGSISGKMRLVTTQLNTINTTLGSPFQAGGSIGNTAFGISGTLPDFTSTPTFNLGTLNGAATAANQTSVIGPVGAGSAAANSLLTGGVYNSTPITVTNGQQAALQTDANGYLKVNVATGGGGGGGTSSSFGSAFPSTGTAAGMSQGGNMVALTGTSGNLNVQCANCSGSGASATDASAFTAGASILAPGGGFYQTTATDNALTNGQQGMWQMTASRAGFVNLRNASGTEIGTSGNPVRTDPTGSTTQPVSGTVTAAQATAANLNATVVGTGTFATQLTGSTNNINNISGTISLPTGAATAAKQPALGTAGSASADVLTVQGIASMTPLLVNGSGSTQPVSGTVTANQGGTWTVQPGNTANTTAWLVTGTGGNFPATQSGTWNINNISGTVSLPTGASTAANQTSTQGPITPATATGTTTTLLGGQYNSTQATFTNGQQGALQVSSRGELKIVNMDAAGNARGANVTAANALQSDLSSVAGTATAVNNGTASAGTQRVVLASDGTAISTTGFMSVKIDQTTNGTTNAVRAIAGTTGGSSTAGAIQPNNTTAVVVKGSAGTLYGVQLANIGSAPAYLKIYNATSATCGSGTPVKRLIIPKAGTAADGGGSNVTFGAQGINFSTGITYCVTTGIADSDTTAAASNTVLINVDYQ